jgi:hypothetical protein
MTKILFQISTIAVPVAVSSSGAVTPLNLQVTVQ